jgi:hypothetical protein
MVNLKIQGFYRVPFNNDGPPQDSDRQFYLKASDRFFSLNQHDRLQEIKKLPSGAKKIHDRGDNVNDQSRPTNEFYVTIDSVKTEFGDDITLFMNNGCIIRSFWDYLPGEEISIPLLRFYTPYEAIVMEVSNTPDDMDDIKIEFLD